MQALNLLFEPADQVPHLSGGVFGHVGGTPLVRLTRVFGTDRVRLYAKLEGANPGGSIKDRAALEMMRHALSTGEIRAGSVIVESSSGNMGIALAQACRYLGLRFICVVDPNAQQQNLRIMEAFGAELSRVTEPDPATGEWLPARLQRVAWLLKTVNGAVWLEQYRNPNNVLAHHRTIREIVAALDGDVDYVFCGTSTCGTVVGCAEWLRENGLKTTTVAVDAEGSAIFDSPKKKRLLPGLGAGVVPPLCRPSLIDRIVHVSDLDCVVGCRRLAKKEALLVGASSGGLLMGLEKMLGEIPAGSTCVLVCPDRGERYLDTIFSDGWVREHFGDSEELWSLIDA